MDEFKKNNMVEKKVTPFGGRFYKGSGFIAERRSSGMSTPTKSKLLDSN